MNCVTCNKWFTTKRTLLKHRLWHHKEEFSSFKFNCNECPYVTNVLHAFKRHGTVHDKQRPYVCDICGNRFQAPSQLSTHSLIHTGERRDFHLQSASKHCLKEK